MVCCTSPVAPWLQVLSLARGGAGVRLQHGHRHVELWLRGGRAVPGAAAVPGWVGRTWGPCRGRAAAELCLGLPLLPGGWALGGGGARERGGGGGRLAAACLPAWCLQRPRRACSHQPQPASSNTAPPPPPHRAAVPRRRLCPPCAGACEHDLLTRHSAALGPPPAWLLRKGKHTDKFFRRETAAAAPAGAATAVPAAMPAAAAAAAGEGGEVRFALLSQTEFEQRNRCQVSGRVGPGGGICVVCLMSRAGPRPPSLPRPPKASATSPAPHPSHARPPARPPPPQAPQGKRYFSSPGLADIISTYPLRPGLSDEGVARERAGREALLDLLLGVLDMDPTTRWGQEQTAFVFNEWGVG
jgi:hypothetical protein